MMASSKVSRSSDLILAWLVLLFTPAIVLATCFHYAAIVLLSQRKFFSLLIRGRVKQRTVLITGTNNAFGLNLARSFHRAGFRVLSADLKVNSFLSIANKSQAISLHYDVPQLSAVRDASFVARGLVQFARTAAVSLWIDCSDLPQSVISIVQKELREKTTCFTRNDVNSSCFQDRDTFLEFLQSRNFPTPEHYKVKSRGQIHNILNESRFAKRFLLTSPGRAKTAGSRMPLPSRSASQTYKDISKLKIQPDSFFFLDEEIETGYECLTVVSGRDVRFFWACRKESRSCEPLIPGSSLWQALHGYTEAIAKELGVDYSNHLVLSFGLKVQVTNSGVVQQILPNNVSRIDPRFVLCMSKPIFDSLVKAYQLRLDRHQNGILATTNTVSTISAKPVANTKTRYFLMEELKELLLVPCIEVLLLRKGIKSLVLDVITLLSTIFFCDEALYDFYDPIPAYWTYSVMFVWSTFIAEGKA